MDVRKLHEPVSPVTSGIYTALLSVIQAFPLAAVLLVFDNEKAFDAIEDGHFSCIWKITIRMLIVFAAVAVVWHRYVLGNNQTCWRLGAFDTAIPFLFGIVQCFLAVSIRHSTAAFGLWFFMLTFLGFFFSYVYAYVQISRPYARRTFLDHFGHDAPGLEVYSIVKEHFCDSFEKLFLFSAAMIISLLIIHELHVEETDLGEFIVDALATAAILHHFYYDSNRLLREFYDPVDRPTTKERGVTH